MKCACALCMLITCVCGGVQALKGCPCCGGIYLHSVITLVFVVVVVVVFNYVLMKLKRIKKNKKQTFYF